MKLNMLILGIFSLIQLGLVIWHLFRYRKFSTAIGFILFGLVFGIVRSNIIYLIQVTTNNSLLPYQLRDSVLRIGNDSVQVYIGWIVTAYYAWCFSEIILDKQQKFLTKLKIKKGLPALLSLSFIFIASFSYMVETAASYAGWWDWNASLSTNFANSLFINVPWVGIVDWATVAFEFLGIFILSNLAIKTKKLKYLSLILFPLIHWASHLYYFSAASALIHLSIPIFAACFIFINMQSPIVNKKDVISYKAIWIAFYTGAALCILSDILISKSMISLLSIMPLLIVVLLAIGINVKNIYYFSFSFIALGFILFANILTRKQIVISIFPIVFLSVIYLLSKFINLVNHYKNNSKIIASTVFAIAIVAISLMNIKLESLSVKPINNGRIITDKKRLILITIDTLRNDHTGVGGYDLNTTPNLDKFRDDSIYFSDAYSPIPLTYPAHLSLFTGKYPNSLGVDYNSSSNTISQPTLAELFKQRGYKTSAFISSSNLDKYNIKKGFELFDSPVSSSTRSLSTPKERSALDTNTNAFRWLDKNKKDPFFTWIHYYDSHQPYNTHCPKSYSIGRSPQNSSFSEGVVGLDSPIPTTADYEFLKSRYDEEIKCQDDQLGSLVGRLKKLGIYNDSNIIIASDHGENFDHNSVFHGQNLYEGSLRVPLLIKMKGLSSLNQSSRVILTDVFPTVVELFNLNYGLTSDGINLNSKKILERKDLYFQTTSKSLDGNLQKKVADINGEYKFIAEQTKTKNLTKFESYNIKKDPDELNNTWTGIDQKLGVLKDNLYNYINY